MPGQPNLVFGMGLLVVSGVAVWSGIVDPEGGTFAGLRTALQGGDVAKRAPVPWTLQPGQAGFVGPTAPGVTQPTGEAIGPAVTVSGARSKVLAEAATWLGTPYLWGGETKEGADCSGFTQAVFAKFGVDLPRVSAMQALSGTKVSAAKAQPGDLVAFGAPVHHVGILAARGQIIHAPHPGTVIRYENIWTTEPVFYRNVLDKPRKRKAAAR